MFYLNARIAHDMVVDKNEINVSTLNPGMYIVRVRVPGKQLTQKIIIE
jgi:hypothetical protein